MRGEMPMSARNFMQVKTPAVERIPLPAMPHIAGIGEYLPLQDMDSLP